MSPAFVIAISSLAVILGLRWHDHALFLGITFSSIAFAFAIAQSAFHRRSSGSPGLQIALLVGGGLAFGTGLGLRVVFQAKAIFVGLPIRDVSILQGIVTEDSRITEAGQTIHRFDLISVCSDDGSSSPARGRVVLFDHGNLRLYAGQRVQMRGSIRLKMDRPERFYIGSGQLVSSFGFASPFYRRRALVLRALLGQIENLGYPASSLFKALFLGVRDEVPEIIQQGFVNTGTCHFLAISGLHVGIVCVVVLFLTRMLRQRFLRWALASALLMLYLFLVGPRPSMVRASITAMVAGLSTFLDRDSNPLNLFGLVLLAIQLIDPYSAYSLAFQLSFLSVGGILFIGRALYRSLQRYVPAAIGVPLAYSVGAQLATAPVQLAFYGIYYPVGVIVTVLLIPLVSFFIWCGLALLILDSIAPCWFGEIGRIIMHALCRGILAVLEVFSNTPGLTKSFLPYYWYLLGIGIMFRLRIGIALAPGKNLTSIRSTLESENEEGFKL